MIAQVSPVEVASWRADPDRDPPLLLDVREPWEVAICSIERATAIPLGQLVRRVQELPADRPIVCVCHHGHRSQQAAMFLQRSGFKDVYNLAGGIAAWADQVEPAMRRY